MFFVSPLFATKSSEDQMKCKAKKAQHERERDFVPGQIRQTERAKAREAKIVMW